MLKVNKCVAGTHCFTAESKAAFWASAYDNLMRWNNESPSEISLDDIGQSFKTSHCREENFLHFVQRVMVLSLKAFIY